MIQLIQVLIAAVLSSIAAMHFKNMKINQIKAKHELDRHHESMANLIRSKMKDDLTKEQYRLIKLYEEEIMRLESLNDNLLNELKYKDIK